MIHVAGSGSIPAKCSMLSSRTPGPGLPTLRAFKHCLPLAWNVLTDNGLGIYATLADA